MILIDRAAAEECGKKLIMFPDAKTYQPMFYLEDGKNLAFQFSDGDKITKPCKHLGSHHFMFGTSTFHIHQFAELHERNGNTYEPLEQITDLSLFRKFYADRSLKGEDGKIIPYRSLVGFHPDNYNDPRTVLSICPEAEPDRQVCVWNKIGDVDPVIQYDFYSIPEAWTTVLPILPVTRHELNLVSAVFEANNRQVEHISQQDWDKLPKDAKGHYRNFDGNHPDWEGKQCGFLPGHGTTLFIEGVSFVIDKGKTLDEKIASAQKRQNGEHSGAEQKDLQR